MLRLFTITNILVWVMFLERKCSILKSFYLWFFFVFLVFLISFNILQKTSLRFSPVHSVCMKGLKISNHRAKSRNSINKSSSLISKHT